MSAERTKHSAGWYAGALVFWATTAWLIVVGLSSIIPQIFWPQGRASSGHGCRPALRELQHELIAETAAFVERGAASPLVDERAAFFRRFDDHLKNIGAQCGADEQKAFDELVRVRHTLSGFLDRYAREEAPRMRKLNALLDHDPHTPAP